ncbi:hypothetical protein EPA93_16745 [Ktedonosporobacter rubrisoli]|uniref:Core-binding (CB) domain-containing protein n=1 Tax=Ktedonosporobacter rubrisoli TaxID=2509675 RepID=A0A4P6K5V7_KTERU|nr:hypothetical protein EPA93_16745 [Ktedonosporobacter rubrisoli]
MTTEIIQTYLARQESLAPTTYNRRLAALRSFLKFLCAWGGKWLTFLLASSANRSTYEKHVP